MSIFLKKCSIPLISILESTRQRGQYLVTVKFSPM